GERLLAVQVISESARNVDSLDLPKVKPDGPRQNLGACVNSRFGAQQVGQVGLGDHDIFPGFQGEAGTKTNSNMPSRSRTRSVLPGARCPERSMNPTLYNSAIRLISPDPQIPRGRPLPTVR